MEKIYLVEADQEALIEDKHQYFQIDALKAVMIFLVIFDHIVSWGVKSQIGVALWERISIPVFLVIMGFNMGLSFKRRGASTLKELYSKRYFKSKFTRYIVPFLVLYGFSTLIGLILYQFNITAMYHGQYYPQHGFIQLFTGILPFWGPGNWFLPVIFGSILIFPLIYWAFIRKPILTLCLCFAIEIVMQLTVFFFIGEITTWQEVHILGLFMTSFPFYISAVGLGIWFSFGHKLRSKRNLFIWILFLISLTYLIAYQFFGFRFMINGVPLLRGDYHFLVFPYSAFLFLVVMALLPKNPQGKFSRAISMIGKSTYHILLIQILGLGMVFAVGGTHYMFDVGSGPDKILDIIVVWTLFISSGILWYKIDQNKDILRRSLYYFNFFIVFTSILFVIFFAQISWVPIPLVIIIIYAFAALITKFIIKKPLKTRTLGLWTSFLILNFVLAVLYIGVFQPNEFVIQNIIIGVFLVFVIMSTILDYTNRK